MNIAAETAGCLGKHIWECTYREIDWYVKVGSILNSMMGLATPKMSMPFLLTDNPTPDLYGSGTTFLLQRVFH
jgi:hypothetical protein